MPKLKKLLLTTTFGLFVFVSQNAYAGSHLSVQSDQTQMIALTTEPGTVVVGNPSIADVTVNGKQVFLHGRGFGDTNIMILDANGNQLANFDITVTHSSSNEVMVYAATSVIAAHPTRSTYSCDPWCQSAMVAGDDQVFFNGMLSMNGSKSSLAQTSKSADVAPPQTPLQ